MEKQGQGSSGYLYYTIRRTLSSTETSVISNFRAGFGTETNLVTMEDDLYWGVDRMCVSLLAFSTIKHSVLLSHLITLGLRLTVLQWFWFFRYDKFQRMLLEDTYLAF